MRVTLTLDEAVLSRAMELTGTRHTAAIVHQALEALVRTESARALSALGGSDPDAAAPRRTRGDDTVLG